MLDTCPWLHEMLESRFLIRYPFEVDTLPMNGIYFFYEDGEQSGHGSGKLRIVRVGTHRDGNFRSRIAEHFLLDDSKMEFDETRPPPHDRSIFRKNIGRALLNKVNDPYLKVWNLDLMTAEARRRYASLRSVTKEKEIELAVTRELRQRFAFRVISVDRQDERMGTLGLEAACIGTLTACMRCRPSDQWLGRHSPIEKIRNGKLWLVQHLTAPGLTAQQQDRLRALIADIPVAA